MKQILEKSLLIFFILLGAGAYAQTGKIIGKVIDENGQPLIGANIIVKGAGKGSMTDIDGKYSISIAPGKYNISVSFLGYQTMEISDIDVKENALSTHDAHMKPSAGEGLNTVVVTAKANQQSNVAIVLEQKNSAVLFDGISGDQIKKTPDRTTADVLKRVSGATIQDGQFVVIRGLPERYNAAYLNGAPLPSTEPDRKAFAFDIFPSGLLNDLKIVKTAMPSLPGEFAGGLILVRTKEVPEENFYQISAGVNFNTITSFKPFTSTLGGKTDFLGIDDGTRKLNPNFPTNKEFIAAQNDFDKDKLVEFSKQMNNNYKTKTKKGLPGFNFQYSMGHVAQLNKKNSDKSGHKTSLGSVLALTYYNAPKTEEVERADFDDQKTTTRMFDRQYTENVTMGGIWNIALSISRKNGSNSRISLKNLFNMNTYDRYIERSGVDYDNGFDFLAYNNLYTQNRIISSQLNGEHVVSKHKIRLDWSLGYSNLNRIIPDYQTTQYQRGDSTMPYRVATSNTVQSNKARRFFSEQNDNSFSGTLDLTIPVKIGASRHEIKAGSMLSFKAREFQGRQFGYTRYKTSGKEVSSIEQMSIDSIFDERNFGVEGLMMREVTKMSDTYSSEQNTIAGFLQLESAFFENKLRFIYGVRMENYRQILNTYAVADESPINIDTTVTDFLPSINIVYGFHPKMNLRIAGSQTVTRPESRELAPFSFYDFGLFALVGGNPDLKRTKITNADIRYEFYPSAGQLLSVTGFYKYFQNPIEKILLPLSAGGRQFSYINAPSAQSIGLELEMRMSLSSFTKNNKSRFMDDFFIVGNFAYIHSEVKLDSLLGVGTKRPLQGQSKYIFNGGLQYLDSKYNFGISFMTNYVGKRIFTVGTLMDPPIWENPRWLLDLVVSKSFLENKLELKFSIKDMLAQRSYFYEDSNSNGRFDKNSDNVNFNYRFGQQFSFSMGYKF